MDISATKKPLPKLVFFDLDGTLAESKQAISSDVAKLLGALLERTAVAVISGGALAQFLEQVVSRLPETARLSNAYLLPTSGAALYRFENGAWKKVYEERLSEAEVRAITAAVERAAHSTGLVDLAGPSFGERLENRGAQMSFSALGQKAPLALKKAWDPDKTKRRRLQAEIAQLLPACAVAMGGTTTIDITRRGIDKAYGIRKLCALLGVRETETLYVGDELEKDGNDEAAFKTDVQTAAVASPAETISLLQHLLEDV